MGLKIRYMKLVGACRTQQVTIWFLAARFATFTERNCWAYGGHAWEVSGSRVVLPSPWFSGRVGGVKYCWNRCSSILALEISS